MSTPPARGAEWWTGRRWQLALLLLVIATFAIRSVYFGNPLIDVDEQFYLLTGDRLLHGALPYVDLWDRKPVGLFVLYAAMRALGGDGILQYQLVASGFAAGTAVMIALIARRIATPGAALLAGFLYIPALAMSGGAGGQTPVFYNLLMAIAVWLALGLASRPAGQIGRPAIVLRGALAMLLVGIAMQIKYTAVFEGAFLGGALLWIGWRTRIALPLLVAAGVLWASLAALPTVSAWAAYAAAGHGADYVYANFTSILVRGQVGASNASHDLGKVLIRLLPFILPILFVEWLFRPQAPWQRDAEACAAHGFLFAWGAAAVFGFLIFGGYFDHYALPLLPPLCVLSAPLFAIRARAVGPVMAAAVTLAVLIPYPLNVRKLQRKRGDAAYIHGIADLIRPRLGGRCLYIFYGEPILYQLTGSCLPSRWSFPFHLSLTREAPALGIDPAVELDRILANRPPVIVDRLNSDEDVNLPIQTRLRAALARDYRLIFSYRHPGGDKDTDRVWERLPGR